MNERGKNPNTQLEALMREAKMSRKGLAARIRAHSRSDGENEGELATTHTLIGKWLSGEVRRPSDRSCRLAAKVLGQALGRPVTVREIGYPDVPPETADTTLVYPATIVDSVVALRQLTGHDLNGERQSTKRLVVPEAWSDLVVTATYGGPAATPAPSDPFDLSPVHVQQVRDATEMFSTFDHRYGGGQSKPLVAKYLNDAVLPLVPRVAPDTAVGREYLQATASLTLRAGWTAYDTGEHAAAQGYLFQAHRFAQAANDMAFSAHALACMSHQANYLGHFNQAVYLARAAVATAAGHATPTAMSLFHAMEARGLASQGNESDTTKALIAAEEWLDKRQPENEPDWMWFFDRAELDAEFAHCFRDLGRTDLARQHAAAAIAHAGQDFVRSSAFCRSVLAASHLLANELDEALAIANGVIESAAHLQSSRVFAYLTDIRTRLAGFSSPETSMFNDRLTEALQLERSPLAGHIIVP